MIVYFSVLAFIILICFLNDDKGNGKLPLGISILAIYLMISFQAGWGGDWEAYNNSFDYYHGMSLKEILSEGRRQNEIGYKLAFSIIPSYTMLKFIFSAWYCFALYVLFYNFMPRKWWSLAFFFLFINRPLLMGGLCAVARTGFAAASFIIGMYFLAKGQRRYFIVILLIASMFHTSALLLLPLLLVPSKSIKIDAFAGVIIFAAIFLLFLIIPSVWTNFVESLIIGSDTFNEYEFYLDADNGERQLSMLLPFTFLWVYELFVYSKKANYSKNDYLMMNMALIQIIFSFLPSVGLSNRFYYYLNYVFFAGMMVLLDKVENETAKRITIISLILVFGKQFLTFYRTTYFAEHWLYYHTFWNY